MFRYRKHSQQQYEHILKNVAKQFSRDKKIGHGAFGEVWKGTYIPTGEKIAIKFRFHICIISLD